MLCSCALVCLNTQAEILQGGLRFDVPDILAWRRCVEITARKASNEICGREHENIWQYVCNSGHQAGAVDIHLSILSHSVLLESKLYSFLFRQLPHPAPNLVNIYSR